MKLPKEVVPANKVGRRGERHIGGLHVLSPDIQIRHPPVNAPFDDGVCVGPSRVDFDGGECVNGQRIRQGVPYLCSGVLERQRLYVQFRVVPRKYHATIVRDKGGRPIRQRDIDLGHVGGLYCKRQSIRRSNRVECGDARFGDGWVLENYVVGLRRYGPVQVLAWGGNIESRVDGIELFLRKRRITDARARPDLLREDSQTSGELIVNLQWGRSVIAPVVPEGHYGPAQKRVIWGSIVG